MRITKQFVAKLQSNLHATLEKLTEEDLEYVIKAADKAYYNKGEPFMNDDMYDVVKDYLKKKNSKNPILKDVGAAIQDKKKQELPYFMGSMDKIKSDHNVLERFKTKFSKNDFVISDKLDGVSALLYYKKKTLKLFTRGDGYFGQDITHIIPHINGLPSSTISSFDHYDEFTVRGELIISKSGFESIKHKGANARNVVAGIVNAKKPDMEVLTLVNFVAYSLIQPKHDISEQFGLLKQLGFHVAHHTVIEPNTLSFEKLSEMLVNRRKKSIFEIDGLIVATNKYHAIEKGKNPSYAFAFKNILTQETAEVVVEQVEWNLSKDGYLKPVVIFNDVYLSGVTIKRATGFNAEYITQNVIGPGSRLVITRSGDVIPYILNVLTPSSSGNPQLPDMKYVWNSTGKDIMIKDDSSDEFQMKRLIHFVTSVDIPGVKEGTVKRLFDGGVKTVQDFVNMTQAQINKIDGLANKTKILDVIREKMKTMDCISLMIASNMFGRGFARKKLENIITKLPKIEDGKYVPSMKELTDIEGISSITAQQFLEGLDNFRKFMGTTKNISCVKQKKPSKSTKHADKQSFVGQTFIFTGFRNKEWEAKIKENGGEVASSLTKNVTTVVALDPSESSGKLVKARSYNIKIISKDEFEKQINAL